MLLTTILFSTKWRSSRFTSADPDSAQSPLLPDCTIFISSSAVSLCYVVCYFASDSCVFFNSAFSFANSSFSWTVSSLCCCWLNFSSYSLSLRCSSLFSVWRFSIFAWLSVSMFCSYITGFWTTVPPVDRARMLSIIICCSRSFFRWVRGDSIGAEN